MIDVAVLVVGALAGWSGWRAGGFHTVVGILGRVVGVAAGLFVAHVVANTAWSFGWRVVVEIVVVLVGLVVGGRIARAVAPAPVRPSPPDRVVGMAVRATVGVVLASFVVAVLALWGPSEAARATAGSLTAAAAGPSVSSIAADVRGSLPADLDGVIPSDTSNVTASGAALTAAETAATVQVLGESSGSTTTVTGSGFVVSGDRVVTAHHVIATASSIVVISNGQRHAAGVVVDDARSDVTVLSVSGLGIGPVSVAGGRVASGTPAVFAGFPGGGPLTTGTATVVGGVVMPAVGSSGVALRPAYRITADVRPGNSGGPLFDAQGDVIGMIDARSLTAQHVGFAVTAEPILAALDGSA